MTVLIFLVPHHSTGSLKTNSKSSNVLNSSFSMTATPKIKTATLKSKNIKTHLMCTPNLMNSSTLSMINNQTFKFRTRINKETKASTSWCTTSNWHKVLPVKVRAIGNRKAESGLSMETDDLGWMSMRNRRSRIINSSCSLVSLETMGKQCKEPIQWEVKILIMIMNKFEVGHIIKTWRKLSFRLIWKIKNKFKIGRTESPLTSTSNTNRTQIPIRMKAIA